MRGAPGREMLMWIESCGDWAGGGRGVEIQHEDRVELKAFGLRGAMWFGYLRIAGANGRRRGFHHPGAITQAGTCLPIV